MPAKPLSSIRIADVPQPLGASLFNADLQPRPAFIILEMGVTQCKQMSAIQQSHKPVRHPRSIQHKNEPTHFQAEVHTLPCASKKGIHLLACKQCQRDRACACEVRTCKTRPRGTVTTNQWSAADEHTLTLTRLQLSLHMS